MASWEKFDHYDGEGAYFDKRGAVISSCDELLDAHNLWESYGKLTPFRQYLQEDYQVVVVEQQQEEALPKLDLAQEEEEEEESSSLDALPELKLEEEVPKLRLDSPPPKRKLNPVTLSLATQEIATFDEEEVEKEEEEEEEDLAPIQPLSLRTTKARPKNDDTLLQEMINCSTGLFKHMDTSNLDRAYAKLYSATLSVANEQPYVATVNHENVQMFCKSISEHGHSLTGTYSELIIKTTLSSYTKKPSRTIFLNENDPLVQVISVSMLKSLQTRRVSMSVMNALVEWAGCDNERIVGLNHFAAMLGWLFHAKSEQHPLKVKDFLVGARKQ